MICTYVRLSCMDQCLFTYKRAVVIETNAQRVKLSFLTIMCSGK